MDSNHRPLPCQGSALDQLSYGPADPTGGLTTWRAIARTLSSLPCDLVYFLAAHAIPSGPLPVEIRPVTEKVFRSTTATWLSGLTAT
jgi:hypothetical protein